MSGERKSFWLTTKGVAALSLIGAVTYFLLTEHREHVFSYLPYLIFLACPLMHLFMHRGHGHGHHGRSNRQDKSGKDEGRTDQPEITQSPHDQGHPRGSS
jgi:hypothetical protein